MKLRTALLALSGLAAVYFASILLKIAEFIKRKNLILAKGMRRKRLIQIGFQAIKANLPTVPAQVANKVLTASLSELILMRDSGAVSCAQMVLSCIHQTIECDEKYSFVLDERFKAAYDEALECDKLIAAGKSKGLLTGIPFSAKDIFGCEGMITAYGCANLSDNTIESDSVVIALLKANGAILLLKSSMGMLGVTAENSNRIVGVTLNPWDITRVPGGSSGGDAVALSTHCVAFAMGSDVGGSVRFPAAYCGLYTIKTSINRLSGKGPVPRAGHPQLLTAYGPLTRSVDDLVTICKVLISEKQHQIDPLIPPLPWRNELYESAAPLRIGLVRDNAYWPVSAANKRVCCMAGDALASIGHEIVPFELGDLREMCELACLFMFSSAEGAAKLREEPPLAQHSHVVAVKLTPLWARGLLEWYYRHNFYAMVWKTLKDPNVRAYYTAVNRVLKLRAAFNEQLRSAGIDALIVPYPFPAFPHDMTPDFHYSAGYTVIFNLFDLPAGHVPIDIVQADEQSYPLVGDPNIDASAQVMAGAQGLPIGVQVVARRYQEETCLRVMKTLEDHFHFHKSPLDLGK